jgi:sec-independent protein translocase protein TatC
MDSSIKEKEMSEESGKAMSFMEHLDEFRKRLIRSIIFVTIAFLICWSQSQKIYNFLAVPVQRAISEQQNSFVEIEGLNGEEKILKLDNLKENDEGRFVFETPTRLGVILVPSGTSVKSKVSKDSEGKLRLFTDESIYTRIAIIPKGIKLPINFDAKIETSQTDGGKLIVTTATESFTLFVTVSLYSAIALSVPFLLLQIWGFIAPALYKHERSYVTPFILLSTTSFVIGAAFAYYVLFPPAVKYLLWLGADFSLMLRASDYFDFITLIMLAMGIIFQMPAVTYVLARIGLVSAGFLLKSWKLAIVVILIVAAVVSPTGDVPNLMLFATPMMILYLVSIFVAWIFGKNRNIVA